MRPTPTRTLSINAPTITALSITAISLTSTAWAACDTTYTFQKGTYTYQIVSAGQTNTMTSKIIPKGNGYTVQTVVDGKPMNATYRCENGILKSDLQGTQLGISNLPTAKDWRIGYTWTSNATITTGDKVGMSSSTKYKITKMENVTTPAGKFNAYRVESDTTMKLNMKDMPKDLKLPGLGDPVHSVMWYAKGVGMVKTTSQDYSMTLIKISK